jgi:hypothetical protein
VAPSPRLALPLALANYVFDLRTRVGPCRRRPLPAGHARQRHPSPSARSSGNLFPVTVYVGHAKALGARLLPRLGTTMPSSLFSSRRAALDVPGRWADPSSSASSPPTRWCATPRVGSPGSSWVSSVDRQLGAHAGGNVPGRRDHAGASRPCAGKAGVDGPASPGNGAPLASIPGCIAMFAIRNQSIKGRHRATAALSRSASSTPPPWRSAPATRSPSRCPT